MVKNNAYDLLRLIFSIFVIISHCTYITGVHNPFDIDKLSHGQTYLGEIGVIGFFSLSGFLISNSFLRTKNLGSFIWHRALRIFPGFWACIIFTAFAIAPLIYYVEHHTLNNFHFYNSYSSYTYVRLNFLTYIRQAEIAHVLDKSTVHNLNGSLWTLFFEILCYLLTIALGLSGLLDKHKKKFLVVFLSIYSYYLFRRFTIGAPEHYKLFISYLSGSLFCVFHKQTTLSYKSLLILILLFIGLLLFGCLHVLMPVLIPLIFLNLFTKFTVKLKYDLSYGLYIYSFPLQQLINSMKITISPFLFFMFALLFSFLLAFLSFVLIEKPFLRLKKLF